MAVTAVKEGNILKIADGSDPIIYWNASWVRISHFDPKINPTKVVLKNEGTGATKEITLADFTGHTTEAAFVTYISDLIG